MLRTKFRREKTEEEHWLKKAIVGDPAANEWIYRKYVRYLSALCSRYIISDDDIKDVLQEAFIKIFSSLNSFKFRGEGSLKAWMTKITLNETLKFVCSNQQYNFVDINSPNIDITNDDDINTEDIPAETIHQFIRELPDGYRTVFNLYVIDNRNHKDIAQLLGITENTSASQLHKAKALLAKKLKQYQSIKSI